MKVLKFGGTSVGESHAIEQICYILRDKKEQEDRYAIILSAVGGITDHLVKCAQFADKKNEKYHLILDKVEIKHLDIIRELFTILHKKTMISRIIKYLNNLELYYDSICKITYFSRISLDKVLNFGELISSYIINEKLKASGFHSIWIDSRKFLVNKYKRTQVNLTLNVKYLFIKENTPYIILPGFIASLSETETEIEITNLGRGGSDFTASIFSATVQSEYLEIWTDVSGVMTANPKIVTKAFPVKNISYREAIEISYLGAKVIFTPTLLPSMIKNIPIMIKNTFSPLETGTLIFSTFKTKTLITGMAGMNNITFLSLKKKLGMPGYFNKFVSLSSNDIFHVLIKQSFSELCIEKKILREFPNETYDKYPTSSIENELCIIVLLISDMKNIPLTEVNMFSALGKERINFYALGSTEKNIYAVIPKNYFKKSMNIIHNVFFDPLYKYVHLFIAGIGKVGRKLIEQLNKQKEYLVEELHLQIRIIAICNSKIMLFDILGINLNNWQNNLKLGTSMIIEDFIGSLYNLNLRNSIFIDNTASKEISNIYDDILGRGIGVVTCNKIACASSYQEYKKIKNISRYFKAPLFFETNVGAGLPVINTLNYLIASGDKIHLIESVLSGSLNFILTGHLLEKVKKAKKIGLTEPDIRIDLSGIDVIRKILILGRECGESLELDDIKQIPFLTKSSIKAITVDNLYQVLISNEEFFTQLLLVAKEQKKHIQYISKYKNGETFVGLEYIEFDHPFYHLEGKDNLIIYTTDRYVNLPLIVKGAGAGAEVTAAGVFADIIKASI